jgi:hypothetical protein
MSEMFFMALVIWLSSLTLGGAVWASLTLWRK